jgi:hypothetical protein
MPWNLALLLAGIACLPPNSVRWPLEPLPPASSCVVPIDDGPRRVEVTEQSRRACVALARLIEDVPRSLSVETLKDGPPSSRPFRAEEDVSCRFVPRPPDGGSLKFRCLRTNDANQLYDEDHELVPQAVSFDEDGVLLDAEGRQLTTENGKPRKGDELRIKYFVGAEPDARHREMFTETVVSHLFWALGVPVDRVYMPNSVRCFGCAPEPFGQKVPDPSPAPRIFTLASVERRYEGKQINVARRTGWMGLGGGYGHGFAFGELEHLATLSAERRIATEILVTALNVVAYNRPSSYQNELVCRRGKWDKVSGACTEPVAYVQDVGGTLGGDKARSLSGVPPSEMKTHPRGDWPTFSQDAVFRDAKQCTLRYDIAGVARLSEAGRRAFSQRIDGRIGMDELILIFEKARIHRMDSRVTRLAAAKSGLAEGADLDRYVHRMWAEAVHNRFREITQASCPQ